MANDTSHSRYTAEHYRQLPCPSLREVNTVVSVRITPTVVFNPQSVYEATSTTVTGHYHLTIETRAADVAPEAVLTAFAAASQVDEVRHPEYKISNNWWIEEGAQQIDVSDVFSWAFVWAGNLHVGLKGDYRYVRTEPDFDDRRTSYSDCLVPVLQTYSAVNRASFYTFNDTSCMGRIVVYDTNDREMELVEEFKFGQTTVWTERTGYSHFPADKTGWKGGSLRRPINYVQSKFGIHTIHHRHAYNKSELRDCEILIPR